MMRGLLVAVLLLSGCMSLEQMNAVQLKALEGTAMCQQFTSLYGKGAVIVNSIDNTKKGATNKGKTYVKCGEAEMTIEHDVGVPVPAGATTTTTTTTVVKPVQ
jgi:hypothetical protein